MKLFMGMMMFEICLLLSLCKELPVNAQTNPPSKSCQQPVVLKLVPSRSGGTDYEISGKLYTGYPLDDLRKLLSACPVSRPLYVLIDSRIPIGQISSAVAPKLQVDNVRYFIRYPESEHLIIEVKIGEYLSRLP